MCVCVCAHLHDSFIALKSVINLELRILFWGSHLKLTWSEELIFKYWKLSICPQCSLLWVSLNLVILPSCIRQNNFLYLDLWLLLTVFFPKMRSSFFQFFFLQILSKTCPFSIFSYLITLTNLDIALLLKQRVFMKHPFWMFFQNNSL